jgi:hypothetical protein
VEKGVTEVSEVYILSGDANARAKMGGKARAIQGGKEPSEGGYKDPFEEIE